MNHLFLSIASALGAIAVAIGAFGAHGLEKLLIKNGRLDTFETGVKYHFYHALALLLVAVLSKAVGVDKHLTWAGWSFVAGILIFSGSLYILSLTNIRWLGAITPIGGLFLIIGWACLFYYSIK
ncbi:MAG TPA: DUF423 domain-containing protein [Cytophagales bacterium]|nr:DUF423 domain-containing protein [Cytophagales bacterium]